MCMTCEPAIEARRIGILPDAVPNAGQEPAVHRWNLISPEQRHAEWLAMNAARPVPLPVCRDCEMPHDERDGHPLIRGMCQTCGGQIFEDLTMDFIFARGRKAKKRASRRLRRLAK